jgi:hypothetical protein
MEWMTALSRLQEMVTEPATAEVMAEEGMTPDLGEEAINILDRHGDQEDIMVEEAPEVEVQIPDQEVETAI